MGTNIVEAQERHGEDVPSGSLIALCPIDRRFHRRCGEPFAWRLGLELWRSGATMAVLSSTLPAARQAHIRLALQEWVGWGRIKAGRRACMQNPSLQPMHLRAQSRGLVWYQQTPHRQVGP